MTNITDIESMARKLHELYLEATRELNSESYNSNAQKSYDDLTEEQKEIDRYIAKAICKLQNEDIKKMAERIAVMLTREGLELIYPAIEASKWGGKE